MTIRRKLLIGLLTVGTVGGYAAGFASLGWHARGCAAQRRQRFEDRVAETCVRAARRVLEAERAAGAGGHAMSGPAHD